MKDRKYLTVTALTKYIKAKFERDIHLKQVFLKGEISNFKAHSRGHYYFSLKDESAKINAVMFKSSNQLLNFMPENGMKVMVVGRVDVFISSGSYQIYVDELIEDGVGNLYFAFEQLKKKLQLEGLFDERYKKPIPTFPKKVGIVTAPTGAAIRDILSTIKRRYPICETILFPALVQGEYAAPSIVDAINNAELHDVDVLIVGRGGGSIEDLWAFNEEIVARKIFESKIPIISAVGHEVDFTISDFVSDRRAPTPTGAAEMAVPNMHDIINYIDQMKKRLNNTTVNKIKLYRSKLNSLLNSYALQNPMRLYEIKEQKLDNLIDKLENNMSILMSRKEYNYEKLYSRLKSVDLRKLHEINLHKLKISTERLENNMLNYLSEKKYSYGRVIDKLSMLNPLDILKRGYSVVRDQNDNTIKSVNQINEKDDVKILFSDGVVTSKVIDIKEGELYE